MSECCITNFAATFAIAEAPQNSDLDLTEFEALDYIEVPGIVTMGDTGVNQNVVTLSTWDRNVVCKGKGEADAGEVEVEFCHTCNPGIEAMLERADVNDGNNYAFRVLWNDGSAEYNRGLVVGSRFLKGGNEDFKRISFTLAMNQVPITVCAEES